MRNLLKFEGVGGKNLLKKGYISDQIANFVRFPMLGRGEKVLPF